MGAAAAAIAAAILIGGGTAIGASSASKKRGQLLKEQDQGIPDVNEYTRQYFSDLNKYEPMASDLSNRISQNELKNALALREQALPGVGAASAESLKSITSLLKGELPPSVMSAFMRAGGASSVGSGFGGTGFGFLNTGLFGARGSLGAIQLGQGLLPSLLSTMPSVNTPSALPFLSQIMSPAARTQTQLQVRGQNIDIAKAVAGMQTGSDVAGQGLISIGSIIGGMAGGGGGGGFNLGGSSVPNYGNAPAPGGYAGGGSTPNLGAYTGGSIWGTGMFRPVDYGY